MRAKDIVKGIQKKIRYGSIVEWYNFWYIVLRKKQRTIPQVASIDDTIRKIVTDKCSVSRFGDGELLLIDCNAIGFQKGDPMLAQRLIEVIQSHNQNHLVCISDSFRDLYRYNRKARRFWRTHFFLYGWLWDKYLKPQQLYYNTFVTRPYMDFASKEQCGVWFHDLKTIWENRNIIFIEGEKSRLGIGNDLFDNAKSTQRILCPPRDAFDKYNEILAVASKLDKDVLFLIALGPTATVLAYDLYKLGYQAIDAGHIDIEYEWWRMGAKRKVRLPQKYVNEAIGGDNVVSETGDTYQKQILIKIE